MADILRATRSVPGFLDAAQVHLIEASEPLRALQRDNLASHEATWHDAAEPLPDLPLFLIANEFFDALPIRQFQRDARGWRERQIGVQDGKLTFGLSGPVLPAALTQRLEDTAPGQVVELSPASTAIAQDIGARVAKRGGAALIIDYGDWRSLGDTFQALKGHAPVDPLDCPGKADLTAHVDFEALAHATTSRYSRLTPQGVFLERLGITERAQAIARTLSGEALKNHVAAHRRLTHPQEMGTLFKVLAFYPDEAPPPPGLEP